MARNKSQQAIIDRRRTLVARARLHGATQREIVAALRKQGELNRDTGNPWALVTVNRDLKAIQKAWQADAQRDIAEYTSEQIAELREVRRKAWSLVKLDTVLRSLAQEAKLLGLDAPDKLSLSGEQVLRVSYVNDWRPNNPTLPTQGPADSEAPGEAIQLAGSGEALAQDDTGHGDSGGEGA